MNMAGRRGIRRGKGNEEVRMEDWKTFLGSRGFGELTLCQLPFCQLPTFHPVGLISETEIK
jgi:hypothetical protein